MSPKRALASASLAIAIVGLTMFMAIGSEFSRHGGIHWSAPIAGELTTLETARTRVDFPIPTLPVVRVPSPCVGGAPSDLRLMDVYATPEDGDRSGRSVALVYSNEVVVIAHDTSAFRDDLVSGPDLPPVGESFDRADYPDGLTTGLVRDHTAWLNERALLFDCTPTDPYPSNPAPGPSDGPGPFAKAPLRFVREDLGHMTWMENGAVVSISGPYRVRTLKDIAEQIVWV